MGVAVVGAIIPENAFGFSCVYVLYRKLIVVDEWRQCDAIHMSDL